MKGIGGHHRPNNGATCEWLTPPEIVSALGRFDLDPCSPASPPWSVADYFYSDGGLEREWRGRVWLNPPYGQHATHWMKRLAEHGNGVAILFARTETAMFFAHVWPRAHALLFIEGRLHFHHANGARAKANAGGPSVLIAYGLDNATSLRTCGIAGKFVRLRRA